MNPVKNLYIERMKQIRNDLCVALKLLQTRSPLGILAILKRTRELLPYNADRSLRQFPCSLYDMKLRKIKFNEVFKLTTHKIITSLIKIINKNTY